MLAGSPETTLLRALDFMLGGGSQPGSVDMVRVTGYVLAVVCSDMFVQGGND